MFGFKYFTPTKVVFGKDTELQVAELVREFGGKKVLIHYGGGSVVRSGLLKRVTDALDAAGIPYVTLGGAVPNPRLGLVYEGIELCRREVSKYFFSIHTPSYSIITVSLYGGIFVPVLQIKKPNSEQLGNYPNV